MIITRTPFRMSFVGGGSDLPSFYTVCPGHVISTTIDKYMYISIHEKFFDNIRINYSKTEEVANVSEIQHPIVRETLKHMDINDSIEISSLADIPSKGSGLGSSSSYTVGLLNALHIYKKIKTSRRDLAENAFFIESSLCGEPGGKQDQYAAAFGGMNHYIFNPDGSVEIEPINLSDETKQNISSSILMFYTGYTRRSSLPLNDVIGTMKTNKNKIQTLKEMSLLYLDFKNALINGDIRILGEILHESWQLKKSLSDIISSSSIDDLYKKALNSGAIGGKILGAGNGGFLMFLVSEDKQNSVRDSLKDLREVKVNFDYNGTQQIFNDNE